MKKLISTILAIALVMMPVLPQTAFAAPGDTIPPGTTTAFDQDSYSVTAGGEMTIVTSTTFPDYSLVDSSIYEDGRITLDKPFANDVVFTLKYSGTTIGTCTLDAGDTSLWVSELTGTTPRQPLSALSNNTDEFSVVAAIPIGESGKTIEVTIEALAVNATGEDMIQVLASDEATITINPTTVSDASELATAVTNAVSDGTIQLSANIGGIEEMQIDKAITIDMNGFNISGKPSSGTAFKVIAGGDLTLDNTSGTLSRLLVGTGEADEYNYEGIRINGSGIATVKANVSIETGLPVFIKGNGTAGSAQLDVYGKLAVSACLPSGDAYAAIQGNGSAGNGGTVINIYNGAEVINTYSAPMYIPQDGVVNVSGGVITGKDAAIALKSGKLNISGGTLTATGTATIPTEGYSNGINGSGCAIQIESNDAYAGNIVADITGGTIISENGYALYEYLDSGNTESEVTGIDISGGSFQSADTLAMDILISEELAVSGRLHVTGGTFSRIAASFALEAADVNATAAGTETDIGTVSALAAGTSFTVKAGTLNAISGKATNMTTDALGGTRVSTITVNSAVEPGSDNFKVYQWAERGRDGASDPTWLLSSLTWESAGTDEYTASIGGALNYGQPLAAGAVTDGPFAFKVDNASTITVSSVIKNGETVLSNELVQTITVDPEQDRSFALEADDVNATAAETATGLGTVSAQTAGTDFDLKTGTLYAISGKATNKTSAALGGTRISTITVNSAAAPDSDNFKVFIWLERTGNWMPLALAFGPAGTNTYSAPMNGALNYGDPLAAGAATDGPFAFRADNASTITVQSVIKDGATVLSNELVQTITVNPDVDRSFALETADVNATAAGTPTDIGTVSAKAAGTSFTVKAGTLNAISGKATNMTTGALGGTRVSTITVNSAAAPDSDNFKVFIWLERTGNWMPKTLAFEPAGTNTYTASMDGALNYGDPLAAGAVTDGPFAFKVDNASVITVQSVIKDGETVLSDELVQTITVNPLEHSVYTLSTGTVPTGLLPGHEADVNVTLAATDIKDIGYDKALVKVEADKPGAHLYATDTEGDRFDAAEVGYWGPSGGFPISKSYSATTPFTCSFDAAGTYKVTLSLVDMAKNEEVIASKEITIDVASLATTIADGSTTVLDSDTYPVIVGEKLTMSATTQFPNMSGADASIYEDGLVTLDKAFDNDVTLSLKYNGTPVGSYTLPAGDKSFWVSQFANMTPRQKLNVFTTGAANTITIEAAIPVTESAKTMAVTISAVAATAGNFDNESNWTKVLASDTAAITISPITLVTGITLSGPTKMNPNTSITLTANVSPTGATNKAVTWSSSNTSIATVDNGVVTALKTGTVTITATAADASGKKGTRTITVTTSNLVAGITISGTPEAGIGKTITLRAGVTPSNAASRTVTWSSLNTSIATVDTYGRVTGKAAGSVIIRATAADGSAIYGEYTVTVKPAATKVTISGAKLIDLALADKTIQLAAAVSPAEASQLVTWSSSSTRYATVDQTGKVTGIKAGAVTITAKAKDGSGRYTAYTVTISTLVNSVTVGGPSEVATGKKIQLTCSVLPAGATNKSVTWSIPAAYSAFATVSSTGLVTAKTVTADTHITVIATAKDYNKVASLPYDVTVKAAAASQADIYSGETKVTGTTQKIDMFEGVTLQLAARITPAEASQYAAWSTSSSFYATVDATGLVTFKNAGTVTIYATARDGSGKKAYVTFKVSTLVHTVAVGGPAAVAQGKKIQLTTSFNAGSLTPTSKLVKWTSSDTSIATVSSSGLVTAAKFAAADPDEKTVTITATAQDGTNVKGTYDVTVKKNGAASVDITYDAVSVKGKAVAADLTMKGLGIEFSAAVSPSDKASQGVVWSSSNTKVVTVLNGVVKVVGKGTAAITVTATDGTGVKATFTITVVDKVVTPLR